MRNPSSRQGFTLIELVLAIFIFSVGALGLAATTAQITRSLAASAMRERALKIASARIEQLRSLSCTSVRGGSETVNRVVSAWTAAVSGPRITILESVTYLLNGAIRTDSYPAVVRCQP